MKYVQYINSLIKERVGEQSDFVIYGQNIDAGSSLSGLSRGLSVKDGLIITDVNVPSWSNPSPDPGMASCHQSMYWFELSRPNMTCPAQRPTPLSELPTGNDGLLHNAHCPRRESINKKNVTVYFIGK